MNVSVIKQFINKKTVKHSYVNILHSYIKISSFFKVDILYEMLMKRGNPSYVGRASSSETRPFKFKGGAILRVK